MTNAALTKLRKIPLTKRIELVDELMQSIVLDQGELPASDDEKAMIDKGLEELKRHPDRGIPLAEFRKELKTLSRKMRAGARRKSA